MLEDQLLRLQNICYYCLLDQNQNGSRTDYNHFLYNCSSSSKDVFVTQVRQLERALKQRRLFKAGSCCF